MQISSYLKAFQPMRNLGSCYNMVLLSYFDSWASFWFTDRKNTHRHTHTHTQSIWTLLVQKFICKKWQMSSGPLGPMFAWQVQAQMRHNLNFRVPQVQQIYTSDMHRAFIMENTHTQMNLHEIRWWLMSQMGTILLFFFHFNCTIGSIHTVAFLPRPEWGEVEKTGRCFSYYNVCDFFIEAYRSFIQTWIYLRFVLHWSYLLSRHLFYIYLPDELGSTWTYFFKESLHMAYSYYSWWLVEIVNLSTNLSINLSSIICRFVVVNGRAWK